MPVLQFKRCFRAAIETGHKTQTLRAKRPRGVEPGAALTLMNGMGPQCVIGRAVVASVGEVRVEDLDETDARLDGFEDLAALREALRRFYPRARRLWRVRWRDFRPAGARP